MKSVLFSALLAAAASTPSFAQTIQGQILDANGRPVPFVAIGVVGQPVGAMATEQGTYRLTFRQAQANDTVRVSSLGYRPLRLTLRELAARPQVVLLPEALALPEVQVRGRRASAPRLLAVRLRARPNTARRG